MLLWQLMEEGGCNSGPSILLEASVHNQRVEQFDRDINHNIRDKFADIFYSFENDGLLDVTCEKDRVALYYTVIPRIIETLKMLPNSHNSHATCTERNKLKPNFSSKWILLLFNSYYSLPMQTLA